MISWQRVFDGGADEFAFADPLAPGGATEQSQLVGAEPEGDLKLGDAWGVAGHGVGVEGVADERADAAMLGWEVMFEAPADGVGQADREGDGKKLAHGGSVARLGARSMIICMHPYNTMRRKGLRIKYG